MSDIFKLYTLAGFPGLPCIGTVMEFGEGSETRRAVITSVPSNQVSLITLDKRETMLVRFSPLLHLFLTSAVWSNILNLTH